MAEFTADQPRVETLIFVHDPATGEEIGQTPVDSAESVMTAVQRARTAQPAWAALPYRRRAEVMKRFHDLLLRRRDEMIALIQRESGRARRDCFEEIYGTSSTARYYIYHGAHAIRSRSGQGPVPLRNAARVAYLPWGVVGVIAPYNYPLVMATADAIPALLAGNAVLLKPSEQVPLTALKVREVLIEAGLPADLYQVVNGYHETAGAVVDFCDFIQFTGGEKGGHAIYQRAAQQLKPVSLELGGKNAVIVMPDANLHLAAVGVVAGSFANTGQICLTWERAYIHESIYEAFVDRLIAETKGIRMGQGKGNEVDYRTLISAVAVAKCERHVHDAVSKGATVLWGGKSRPEFGPAFFEPTVLADVRPGMLVYEEETFGPVLSLYRYRDEDEVLAQCNAPNTGLNYGIFSRDVRRAEKLARRLEAGTVAINESSYYVWGAMGVPQGGFKRSGIGRRHGPEGIRKFTQPQAVVINRVPELMRSFESALAVNATFEAILAFGLRIWRFIPLIR